MSEQSRRNTGTAGGWWNLTIRFKADEDFAVPNGRHMTSDIGQLLSKHFNVDPVYVDDLSLVGHKRWTTGDISHPGKDGSEQTADELYEHAEAGEPVPCDPDGIPVLEDGWRCVNPRCVLCSTLNPATPPATDRAADGRDGGTR